MSESIDRTEVVIVGGGIHGLRSLEGTFLGTCILGGRLAGQAIAGGG